LIISTYRLREHLGTNPVATLMMHDMIERIAKAPSPPEEREGFTSPALEERRQVQSEPR
jgi:hypothetical protein